MNTKASDDKRRTPELVLERAAAGELPAAHLRSLDPEDRDAVSRLVEDNEADLRAYPAEQQVPMIQAKVQAARRQRRLVRFGAGATLVPACAAALLLFAPSPPTEPTERLKGPAILQVFRRTPEGEERLSAGATARAGDVLQLRFDARGRPFGAVVSLDGAGVVTPHLPDRLEGPAAELERALVTLPNAYELDDAPRFERFFLVTGAEPFDVADVAEALRSLGPDPTAPLDLPAGLSQVSLRLDKAP